MRQSQETIEIATRAAGLIEITDQLSSMVRRSGIVTGLATAFCRHTSCSLLLQENADPDVRRDLTEFFRRLVPEGMDWIAHRSEGPDDMPAHIKAVLTQSSISVPVAGSTPLLGTWQGLYLFEHRALPHRRQISFHIVGE